MIPRTHHHPLSAFASSSRHNTPKKFPVNLMLNAHRHRHRPFSTTRTCGATHYDTLSVPSNASKSQIKSSYYKLSKQFHPDINKDPRARERFHAFSEAYSVLGDDRQRRAYDRGLSTAASAAHHAQAGSYAHPPGWSPQWSYETRRRGATHAWEHRARPPPGTHPRASQRPGQHYTGAHPRHDPFSSPHVRRATGAWQPPRTGWQKTEEDKVGSVSSFWRAVQVAGIVMVVAMLGNGINASAA